MTPVEEIFSGTKVVFEIGVGNAGLCRSLRWLGTDTRVEMFEPNWANYSSLLARYGRFKNVKIHNIALFDEDCEKEIVEDGDSSWIDGIVSPSVVREGDAAATKPRKTVTCHSIERYDKGDIDVALMDTEGCEFKILSKMKSRPRLLALEIRNNDYRTPDLDKLQAWLADNDYELIGQEGGDDYYRRKSAVVLTVAPAVVAPRLALLTLYHENYQQVADITLPNWDEYCTLHGYELYAHCGTYGVGRIGFQKMRFLYQKMFVENLIDVAWVLDLDVLITNMTKRFEEWAATGVSYFVTTDWGGLNNGSFIIRRTQPARMILEAMLGLAEIAPDEQNVLIKLYQNSPWKGDIEVLPQPSINSFPISLYPAGRYQDVSQPSNWQPGHLACHLCTISLEERMEIFRLDTIWNSMVGAGRPISQAYRKLRLSRPTDVTSTLPCRPFGVNILKRKEQESINLMHWPFFGAFMQQTPNSVLSINRLLNAYDFARILEIGTHDGGLSALFAFYCFLSKQKSHVHDPVEYKNSTFSKHPKEFYTFDVVVRDDSMTKFIKYMGGKPIIQNVFEEPCMSGMSRIIERPGRTLLVCDGGNKKRELDIYGAALKEGDIVLVHDYAKDRTSFDDKKKRGIWHGWETAWENETNEVLPVNSGLREVCEKHGITPVHADEFDDSMWFCGMKTRRPFVSWTLTPYRSDDRLELNVNPDFARHSTEPRGYIPLLLDEIRSETNHPRALSDVTAPVIVDLGANIGLYSIYYSRWAKKVYAVEPAGSNLKVLESMVAQFGAGKIEVVPVAVADQDGEVSFYEYDDNSTSNSIVQYKSGRQTTVKQVSLNSLLAGILEKEGHIDFVKMDIEGAEERAVESLTPEVAAKIGFFYIECHEHAGARQKRIVEKMKELGYTVQDWGNAKTFYCRAVST